MKRKMVRTHYTLETRMVIEENLNIGLTVTDIAKILHRDRGNISKEIIKHRELTIPSTFGEINNCYCCIKRKGCQESNHTKHTNCSNFELEICDKLKSSPHVCNGCTTKIGCRKAKQYYKASEANTQYEHLLKSSRIGMHYSELELNILNTDFYFLVKQSGSIYHALKVINKNGWNFKKSTIYRQIKEDLLRLKSSDLPRVISKKSKKEPVNKTYKRDIDGHTYEDYEKHKKVHPKAIEWQMDCVQGITGKNQQVFLTLQIVEIKFLFIFIIPKQTAEEVTKMLEKFKGAITIELFNKIIEILLTDNGHEFIKLDDLMAVCLNTNIFYCHPYSSYEKGSIENNHELIRRCIPQGVSLNPYSQEDINLLVSNINSLFREELNGQCPFDLIDKYIPIEILEKLGIKRIQPERVTLAPKLLGSKNINNIKKWLSNEDIKKSHISLE